MTVSKNPHTNAPRNIIWRARACPTPRVRAEALIWMRSMSLDFSSHMAWRLPEIPACVPQAFQVLFSVWFGNESIFSTSE